MQILNALSGVVTEAARLPHHRLTPASSSVPTPTATEPLAAQRGDGGWRWPVRLLHWWRGRLTIRSVAGTAMLMDCARRR